MFIKEFCATGLKGYKQKLKENLEDRDWESMKVSAITLEKDCYEIGAVSLCGKLIRLQIILEEAPIDLFSIKSIVQSICTDSESLEKFLFEYLKDSDIKEKVYLKDESTENTQMCKADNSYHWSCCIQ